MATSKSAQKPMTPNSVKGLMIVEACGIAFLGYWLHSEYLYNPYFQTYFNAAVIQHLTTYTILSGLTIGLAGSFAAVALWRNLRRATVHLETSSSSRAKISVEKGRSTIPLHEEHVAFPEAITANSLESLDQPAQVRVAAEKK